MKFPMTAVEERSYLRSIAGQLRKRADYIKQKDEARLSTADQRALRKLELIYDALEAWAYRIGREPSKPDGFIVGLTVFVIGIAIGHFAG
jgi:hypothetical protein